MSIWPKSALTRSVDPAALMSTADAKEHLRIEHDDEDGYIDGLVAAVADYLDGPNGLLGRCILSQTWVLKTGRLTGKERLAIPVAPYASTTSLKYYDADNEQQTADLADYIIFADDVSGYIEPESGWPAMHGRSEAVELTIVAGTDTAPKAIVQAAKLMLGDLYENREQTLIGIQSQTLKAAMNLLNNYRIGWVKS